jgi:hypothetical protein
LPFESSQLFSAMARGAQYWHMLSHYGVSLTCSLKRSLFFIRVGADFCPDVFPMGAPSCSTQLLIRLNRSNVLSSRALNLPMIGAECA